MHMADALLSPAVGGAMWVATGTTIAYCAKKLNRNLDEQKVPLMGVIGAFVFAAQMINFTIPGTGSSGHLGGGMILAILLGPHAAFLAMASVLTVQSLFFADGGLLALGCNIFNLGFFPCFIAYPFIYKKIVGDSREKGKIATGALLAAIVGLQLGAFGVVLETVFSGISSLPFSSFVMVMQPIHLAIGLVEGVVTATVVSFIIKADPSVMTVQLTGTSANSGARQKVLVAMLGLTVITGGAFSWFASSHPDGLEWAIGRITGSQELEYTEKGIHHKLGSLQEKTAILPDYGFKESAAPETSTDKSSSPEAESWPTVNSGTSVSGLVGGLLVALFIIGTGVILKRRTHT